MSSARAGRSVGADMGVPFLGRIPLDPDVVTQCDAGEPFALFNSDTATAQAYHDIANQVEAFCKKSGSLIKVGPTPSATLKGERPVKAADAMTGLTPLHEAQQIVLDAAPPLGLEKISILDALGRVLVRISSRNATIRHGTIQRWMGLPSMG